MQKIFTPTLALASQAFRPSGLPLAFLRAEDKTQRHMIGGELVAFWFSHLFLQGFPPRDPPRLPAGGTAASIPAAPRPVAPAVAARR